MALQLPVVVVYPAETGLKGIRQVMERVFGAKLDISDNSRAGGVYACVIDVEVPNGSRAGAAWRRIGGELRAVRIKTMKRFRESWWARHNRAIAIGAVAGIAMVLISDLLRPLAERMRGALG